MNDVINYYSNIAILEWVAVIASLAYVVLAAYNNIWCWPAAVVSTILYSVIFYEFYLWSDSALQVYYLIMAFYGWYCWRKAKLGKEAVKAVGLTITMWPVIKHFKAIGLLSIISCCVGYLMASHTPTDFPYYDASTSVFAVFATYLVTQRILENWLYWIIIDFVSIYLYIEKGLLPTAFLFSVFVIIAVFGYFKWLKLFNDSAKGLCHK